jgi:hypothetical protein
MTKAGLLEAELPSPPRAGIGRLVLNGAIFLSAGALAAMAIGAGLSFPRDVDIISPKYQYFAAHRNDYDVLFIGSSRFFHQIIPKQFDQAVAGDGGPKVRSINMAYDAVWPPESFYFLRQLLALHASRLHWVVIELMAIDPRLSKDPTNRDAYWHDLYDTRLALDAIPNWPQLEMVEHDHYAKSQRPAALVLAKKRWTSTHRELLLEMWSNLGRGTRLLQPTLDSPQSKKDDWMETEGYRPEPEAGLQGDERKKFVSDLAGIKAQLATAKMGPLLAGAVEVISNQVREANATPIFVITPTLNDKENFVPTPGMILLPFNDPRKYPDLYDPDLFFDSFHLNPAGAIKFTDALARTFAAQVNALPAAKSEAAP